MGKSWRYNNEHGETVYYKCSSQHCPANQERLKENKSYLFFRGTHSSHCLTLCYFDHDGRRRKKKEERRKKKEERRRKKEEGKERRRSHQAAASEWG